MFPQDTWWNKLNKYISDTGIDTKRSHGYSLLIFLHTISLKISTFDISRTIDTVCDVYFQLKQKKYLHYTAPSKHTQFTCIDELNGALHKVCTYAKSTALALNTSYCSFLS